MVCSLLKSILNSFTTNHVIKQILRVCHDNSHSKGYIRGHIRAPLMWPVMWPLVTIVMADPWRVYICYTFGADWSNGAPVVTRGPLHQGLHKGPHYGPPHHRVPQVHHCFNMHRMWHKHCSGVCQNNDTRGHEFSVCQVWCGLEQWYTCGILGPLMWHPEGPNVAHDVALGVTIVMADPWTAFMPRLVQIGARVHL